MAKFIGLVFGVVLVLAVILGGSLFWDSYVISPASDAESVEFVVEPGASVGEIAASLEEAGIMDGSFLFKVYVRLSGQQSFLQAGSISLTPGMNYSSIVDELTHANAFEIAVTFPEGLTVQQMGEVIAEAFEGVGDGDWAEVTGENGKQLLSSTELFAGIPQGHSLEGYLFPDTYRFRDDATATTIADTMVLTLKRRMAENDIVIPETLVFDNGMTLHEILTLASIVEREVRSGEDMAIVAGIFFTRMQIGMALQADSTVNYITGKDTPSISLEDSQIQSAYNTYQNLGLPPGPISNPGMNAIMAVLNPTDSDYLYFLTSEEGEVIYATTFDQHIANKYKYLY
ncbi:endolytic transglycosylase MltG [Candidatus Uhrbacteria bacterium CG_4_9_14_3_um_filter_50_9]|uniref:Endolytic murein transglycosylase n=1 Tax=Candidatus Uhrbacteria bacterium CG_4_9_14_3_um_filter_50_9 TaxID=1975035 RepID=A0A2M7XDH1_9BACT|nr:MAG: endolytic transglycosylase MltG [Candidatus Uhrbacteria bacterium CG_4_9_14_3_um_filter_50_9]